MVTVHGFRGSRFTVHGYLSELKLLLITGC